MTEILPEWRLVGVFEDLGEQQPSVAIVEGEEIALYRVDDDVFATSNFCTHGMARLSDGYLDGHTIECPLHQGLFDIRTGRCAGDPVEVDLKTYVTRVREGMVEINVAKLVEQPGDRR